MPTGTPDDGGSNADVVDMDDHEDLTPVPSAIPTPAAVVGADTATGSVVWHRKHLRTDDHLALSEAIADSDVVCPLFVFDPAFYDDGGLACDTRVRFLHEAATSLDRRYAAASGAQINQSEHESVAQTVTETPVQLAQSDTQATDDRPTLAAPETRGLTFGYGDPVTLLKGFVDRGWSVLTMATPTSRYGKRRDERVREACGDAVTFLSGDGLVRDAAWPRKDWQSRIEDWLTATQHAPGWGDDSAVRFTLNTGVTPSLVDRAFEISPTKRKIPTGTHQAATTQLREFVDRIGSYPGNISAPQDARDGTSGLSPYINFGLLSIRQVYQYVMDNAPACRGREMFTSRLVWNMHYNQKLVDWPGWTDRAVNPVFRGRNEETHDPALVTAWKQGETGFPMVDASMRCLQETGWLNFRMRAMCASFFTHILQQPWWIGADWYHHHLIDSDVGINYTQWQSQAGLIGKPSQRVYNPRKQVRDHDPDGEWITEWVPELASLPSRFLDRPERAPLAVQEECGVVIGEDYPRPVVDFDSRRETFWADYERRRPEAARALGRPEIANRASFSGGYEAAKAIAEKYGQDEDESRQVSLADIDGDGATTAAGSDGDKAFTDSLAPPPTGGEEVPVPTGAGSTAGAPSPDDDAVTSTGDGGDDDDGGVDASQRDDDCTDTATEQTTMRHFE